MRPLPNAGYRAKGDCAVWRPMGGKRPDSKTDSFWAKRIILKDEGDEVERQQGYDGHVADRDRVNRVPPHGTGGQDHLGFFKGPCEKRAACGDISSQPAYRSGIGL